MQRADLFRTILNISYTKLDFPTKCYQNWAKITKVSHLGVFWVGGLNMAQQSHRFILVVSLHK